MSACKHGNNWPCARAPVNTHPAQTHARTHACSVTKVNKWQSEGNYGPWWNNQHNGWAAPMFSLIKANSHPHQTVTHRVSAGARVSAGGVLNVFTVTEEVLGITAAAPHPTHQQHIHMYDYICSKSVRISFEEFSYALIIGRSGWLWRIVFVVQCAAAIWKSVCLFLPVTQSANANSSKQ